MGDLTNIAVDGVVAYVGSVSGTIVAFRPWSPGDPNHRTAECAGCQGCR